jgi:hypothetical protein
MKRTAIFLLFQVLCFGLFSQSNGFTVLAKSGKVLSNGKEIKIGQLVNSNTVSLSEGAYLGLISPDGKPIELTKSGDYSINDLQALLGKSTGTFSDQFVQFMATEMQESNEDYTAGLGVTGSVERALIHPKVFIPLPKKSKFIGQQMYVQWLQKEDDKGNNFTINIMNMSEEILFTKSVIGSETTLSPYEINTLVPGDLYLLQISNNSIKSESNVVCFFLPTKEENKEICNELGTLLNAKSTTLECIAAAQMLSEKGFHMAALQKYHEAILVDDSDVAANSFSAYINSLK